MMRYYLIGTLDLLPKLDILILYHTFEVGVTRAQ